MKTVAFTMSIGENDYYLRTRYIEYLAKYVPDVVSVILPPTADRRIIREYADRFNGFIFTGGDDVDPELYGEEKKKACGAVHRLRDKFEIALIREVVAFDKPVLGICRGIQVMNVAMGGTLWQDIAEAGFKSHETEPNGHTVHLSGALRNILGAERIITNSYHHQSVKRLGEGLETVAWSDDGLVEGIWHSGFRFFCGVQWHPEMSVDGHSERLIKRFAEEL